MTDTVAYRGRLCLGLPAGLLAHLGRDGGQAHHAVGAAARHGDDGARVSRCLPRHGRRTVLAAPPSQPRARWSPAQHPAGGWNYIYDFAGEASLKDWYATIGANGWRLEEFQHYYGNATFDDAGTSEASQLMLRMHLEGKGERVRRAARKGDPLRARQPVSGRRLAPALSFAEAAGLHGMADYTRHITFNDDVAGENIKFLIMVAQTMGDTRVARADPPRDGLLHASRSSPSRRPRGGCSTRSATCKPAAARSYEPLAFVTHTTANNIAAADELLRADGRSRVPRPRGRGAGLAG